MRCYVVMQCLRVCLCVCVSRSWMLSKRINVSSNFFHRRIATPFLLFRTKRHGNIPTGTPITEAWISGVVGRKSRSQPISGSNACCNAPTARCCQHGTAGPWQVVTLIADSKQRSLLMAGDDDEMFMTRSLNVTPETTEQHLIVCSDKSVSYVTNNKRLHCTLGTIEANYWQTQSIATLKSIDYNVAMTFILNNNKRSK